MMTDEGDFSYTRRVIEALRQRLRDEGRIDLIIRVRPHAARSQLMDILEDGSLKVAVAAPTEDGRANTALVKLLAELFDIPVSSVSILSGANARIKLVRLND
jgi:uncharacterized protein